ncbi:type II restriction endonuclease [Mucilaginibacter xinganensis]|uniref:Restriction endonuclease n=1 Tax=Mucilaginibacter xinganensis TaxID=1234841 RepID=A0A223P3I6_9SPHI|nr:type II restriction endonuclease [Mucilaginibacter xinganensis]ASU36534.1 restriction endonuclease [Mucilaginibacter xinganensis]
MNSIAEQAILSVQKSLKSFCKFISANDAGGTGAHQSGFYIPKNSFSLLFETAGVKGSNKDRFVTIRWQNEFETTSRFIYYGTGTRNEYRLTRFGKGFPFLGEDNVGDLLIISQINVGYYEGFVLTLDDDIENFFTVFNISSNETNKLIEKTESFNAEDSLLECFLSYNKSFITDFPSTNSLSKNARDCYNISYKITDNNIKSEPDKYLLKWLDTEYQLFKSIEFKVYSEKIKTPFKSVEELVEIANTILNRRKSRAGKSLELHLAEVFNKFELLYDPQVITEDNKKPDFIFPGGKYYHDSNYDSQKLIFLASKTTCKDRWRQIINEANRIEIKHLFTLQQGISKNQLNEMYKEGVRLVVPKPYIGSFPEEYQPKILSLENFINFTSIKQT